MMQDNNINVELRKLKGKDAPLMLEWMHDENVIQNMGTDFRNKTVEDCIAFIENSAEDSDSVHRAIVDGEDEYLGTVSLKNIDNGLAEFAIAIRRKAMGTGASRLAMQQIITYGFEVLHLKRIYWCVSPLNKRAIRFYDKNGYQRIDSPNCVKGYTESQVNTFVWYAVNNDNINGV